MVGRGRAVAEGPAVATIALELVRSPEGGVGAARMVAKEDF